jgi:hypothetical protein
MEISSKGQRTENTEVGVRLCRRVIAPTKVRPLDTLLETKCLLVAKIRLGRGRFQVINASYRLGGVGCQVVRISAAEKRGPQRTTSTSYQDDLVTERSEFRVPPYDLPY